MKHIHRFFVSQNISSGDSACLDDDDTFHAARVLRLAPGDEIELADAAGRVFASRITTVDGKIKAIAQSEIGMRRAAVPLTVVQAVPRGQKMDMIVEKLSELGVPRLVPVFTASSVAGPAGGRGKKLDRWRRLARSSASQSKRSQIMAVDDSLDLFEWLENTEGTVMVLSTETEGKPLGAAVLEKPPPYSLVVGPEAGFDADEIGKIMDAGTLFVSLGRQVLRTETAAIVAATVVLHRLGAVG